MIESVSNIHLCGNFINICNMYLISVNKTLKWTKFNYIVDSKPRLVVDMKDVNQYCILITQMSNIVEVVSFLNESDRDISFDKIMACLSFYQGRV